MQTAVMSYGYPGMPIPMDSCPPGYPPMLTHQGATGPYGYPTGPMMLPPGYQLPPGYPIPHPYVMPPGVLYPPPGYPGVHPGHPMPALTGEGVPAAKPMMVVETFPLDDAVPVALLVQEDADEVEEPQEPRPPAKDARPAGPATARARHPVVETALAAGDSPPSTAACPEAAPPPSSALPPPAWPPSSQFRRTGAILRLWRNIGGGPLTLSLLIHAGIIAAAGLVVFTTALQQKQVDFLSGGGTQQGAGASAALSHRVQQKKRSLLKKSIPKQRLISSSLNASINLPDAPPDLFDVPDVSSLLGGGGRFGPGGGFGNGGAGGGFGDGFGNGGLGGITFKPLMMFGMELKDTRKIAVVMDVSRSMTKYLPIVARELDKVAHGSPLVLYFGCGLKTPPRGLEDKIRKVSDPRFDKFWYFWEGRHDMGKLRQDYARLKVPEGEPMPLEAVYNQMKKRSNTYFIDFNGITYTSPALTCREVMEADTLYWFSDFQDAVDVEHIQDVMRRLRGRKQKLYMHASVRGKSFELVRDGLCKPLGGEVLETKVD